MKYFFPTILSELDIIFHGSDAMDGGGITYTISDSDHPAANILGSPFATKKSSSYFIGLSVDEVSTVVIILLRMYKFFKNACNIYVIT